MTSQAAETGIDVSQAIEAAFTFANSIVGKKEELRDIRLEEIDFSDVDGCWLITLSYLREIAVEEETDFGPVAAVAKALARSERKFRRVYKSFAVDATSGKVRTMRIRKPF
jgi:hypothetical protein